MGHCALAVVFPLHALVICLHTCLNLYSHTYIPKGIWKLKELATKAMHSRLYVFAGSILQAHSFHAHVYRSHVKV